MNKKFAYTLTQIVLILAAVITVISLIVSCVFPKYQEKTFETMYKNEVQKFSNMFDNIELAENKDSFFDTTMYVNLKPSDYSQTSGYFLNKYIGIHKDCSNSISECFAAKYKNENNEIINPDFDGACALLRNGISVCLKPQTGKNPASGIMDLNGKSAPNVLGKDLRTFELDKREKPAEMQEQADSVITVD